MYEPNGVTATDQPDQQQPAGNPSGQPSDGQPSGGQPPALDLSKVAGYHRVPISGVMTDLPYDAQGKLMNVLTPDVFAKPDADQAAYAAWQKAVEDEQGEQGVIGRIMRGDNPIASVYRAKQQANDANKSVESLTKELADVRAQMEAMAGGKAAPTDDPNAALMQKLGVKTPEELQEFAQDNPFAYINALNAVSMERLMSKLPNMVQSHADQQTLAGKLTAAGLNPAEALAWAKQQFGSTRLTDGVVKAFMQLHGKQGTPMGEHIARIQEHQIQIVPPSGAGSVVTDPMVSGIINAAKQ